MGHDDTGRADVARLNGAGTSPRRFVRLSSDGKAVLNGLVLLLVAGMCGPGPAHAQAQTQEGATTAPSAPPSAPLPQSDILTVDRDELFSGSLYGRRILAELEQERSRLAAEARKVEAALAAEEQDLTQQRKTLSPNAFRALAKAFDEKVQALRREGPVREQRFTDRFERERLAYFEKIGPILGAVVRDRGGVVIVDRRAILLTTRNIDITAAAIARINAVLGDGSAEQGTDGESSPETPAPDTPASDTPANIPDEAPGEGADADAMPLKGPAGLPDASTDPAPERQTE